MNNENENLGKKENKKISVLRVSLPFNFYKGDGKCWLAKLSAETGKIQEFIQSRTEFEANYKGQKIFTVENEGLYMAHYPYTRSYSMRTIFLYENGKVNVSEQFYGNGIAKGDILTDNDLKNTFMHFCKISKIGKLDNF